MSWPLKFSIIFAKSNRIIVCWMKTKLTSSIMLVGHVYWFSVVFSLVIYNKFNVGTKWDEDHLRDLSFFLKFKMDMSDKIRIRY